MAKPMLFFRAHPLLPAFCLTFSLWSVVGCASSGTTEAGDANGTNGGGGNLANAGGSAGIGSGGRRGDAGGSSGTNTGGNATGGTAGVAGGAAGMTGGAAGSVVANACDPPNVCDGFETYMPGGGFGVWKQNGVGGTLKVDSTHAFSGTQSIQVVSKPGGGQRVQLQRMGTPLFPATNNKFWGRVMARADNLPGKSDMEDKNVHYDLIQSSGTGLGEYRVAGMGGVLLNYEPHDCYQGTNKPIPQNKWACWEWLFDGSKNTIEFYIDSVLQASVVGTGQGCVDGTKSVWQAPAFSQLRIGFVNYQSKAETTTLWMDEFAAGPARIGCPKATNTTH